ncbi:MAG: hypothetical protein KKA84_12025 [Bacteroidetes bacterium]|nr:hypothetical protein [Bacteroidota bacterium]
MALITKCTNPAKQYLSKKNKWKVVQDSEENTVYNTRRVRMSFDDHVAIHETVMGSKLLALAAELDNPKVVINKDAEYSLVHNKDGDKFHRTSEAGSKFTVLTYTQRTTAQVEW